MNLTDQHKALLVTLLISGTVLLVMFNINIKQQIKLAAESYYELEPEKPLTEEEIKQLQILEKLNNAKAETNAAFNEAQKNKHFAPAYKRVAPPEDYVPQNENSPLNAVESYSKKHEPIDSKLDEDQLSSFNKINDLLEKQNEESNNSKSTISYSLSNRKKIYIPVPVYLCEVDGKVVINITVDAKGNVTDTYVNSSSNTSNACLIKHALEYAKKSKFSSEGSKASQIGSITFNFIGKN
ncbi:energy transducer TonB [Algibacter pacificus]|uniref:energy transducer TonB n=1 Tax=Algibacter pacificus TaxID=2599389 RepID=UPI0011CBA242|nr:energy transducer TonB [Algibacter pacificus]